MILSYIVFSLIDSQAFISLGIITIPEEWGGCLFESQTEAFFFFKSKHET